jgi:hypothetical protein
MASMESWHLLKKKYFILDQKKYKICFYYNNFQRVQ